MWRGIAGRQACGGERGVSVRLGLALERQRTVDARIPQGYTTRYTTAVVYVLCSTSMRGMVGALCLTPLLLAAVVPLAR